MSSQEGAKKRGTVYTFYSFKGGAGRSMALANVAALLAKWGRSVLVIDWDIEAPGIEKFFITNDSPSGSIRSSRPGIVDLIHGQAARREIDWRECILKFDPGVSVISAGRDDGEYLDRLQRLDFHTLFAEHDLGNYIERLRTDWISSFDFVLVDSRTGVSDVGGICTVHLPDILVLLFTATDSSIYGASQIVERSRRAQELLPLDRGHLIAVPVPSKDESRTEYEQAMRWKIKFAELFHDFYSEWLPSGISAQEAIELLRIPYVPYWSFGERLPVLTEGGFDPGSIGYAYEILARLLASRLDWYEALEGRRLPPPPSPKPREIDKDWIARHRSAAMKGLLKAQKPGFMEAYHGCLDSTPSKRQAELLSIARLAMVHTFGWPIGVILDSRQEFRPRPTNDGIVADIDAGHDYDYWTLTKSGDFYTLLSLFEDDRQEGVLYFNTRIIRVAEVIQHCVNLYKGFGIEPNASVVLTVRHGGLKGRTLTATQDRISLFTSTNFHEDEVETSVNFKVGVSEAEIVTLVETLCEPLFVIFDYARFDHSVYTQIVTNFIQGNRGRF